MLVLKDTSLVHSLTDFLLLTVLPFNLLKYAVVSFLTYLIYKKAGLALEEILRK